MVEKEEVGLTPKGQPMPQTIDEWRYLTGLISEKMLDQRKLLREMRSKINKLEQKLASSEAKRKKHADR